MVIFKNLKVFFLFIFISKKLSVLSFFYLPKLTEIQQQFRPLNNIQTIKLFTAEIVVAKTDVILQIKLTF